MLALNYIILLYIVFLAILAYPVYSIVVEKCDPETWVLPYKMTVPFDSKSVLGWFLLWFIQCMMSTSYALCVLSTTSYFVCCCIYISTISKHFELLFKSIENDVDQMNNKNTFSPELSQNAQANLHQAIEVHVKIYE